MRGLPTYGMRDSVVRTTCPVVLYRCGRRLGRVTVPVAMAAAIRTVGLTKTVDVEGNHVRCQVIGSVEPLLGVLVASGLHQLLSREPPLEELFLAHYGRKPAAARDALRAV